MGKQENLAGALEAAIVDGDSNRVVRLLDSGADVNLKSGQGAAPLLNALLYNRKDIFELLVARGAKVKVLHGKFNLLLTLASRKGKGLQFVHRLAELGVDPNFVGDDTSPVLHAVRVGNHRFLEKLLELPSLDTRSKHYETAIAWARNSKQSTVASKLLARQRSGVVAKSSAVSSATKKTAQAAKKTAPRSGGAAKKTTARASSAAKKTAQAAKRTADRSRVAAKKTTPSASPSKGRSTSR